MVISIDHGNRQVKTVHKVFVSGLVESSVRPALGKNTFCIITGIFH